VGLALLAAVNDGMEQGRIQFPHPGEISGIGLGVLGAAPLDEAEYTRVGDDHLVAEFAEKPAGPMRVIGGFKNRPCARHGSESATERFRRGCHTALFDHVAGFIQNTRLGIGVSNIEAHGQSAFRLVGGGVARASLLRIGPQAHHCFGYLTLHLAGWPSHFV
jgi:hypothetical protein